MKQQMVARIKYSRREKMGDFNFQTKAVRRERRGGAMSSISSEYKNASNLKKTKQKRSRVRAPRLNAKPSATNGGD